MSKPASYIADHLRHVLINATATPHAEEVQRFFKDEIQSRGWRMKELRQLARRFSRVIRAEGGLDYLAAVADELFRGSGHPSKPTDGLPGPPDVLEEKVLAVLLVSPCVAECTAKHFKIFEQWLDKVSTWADHDALVQYLIGPMIVADPRRLRRVFVWSRSPNRWRRRAAAVALLRGTNQGLFWPEVQRMTQALLSDEDDMVQKGLAWLLRETARYDGKRTIPLLISIRERAPRPVLRTACERRTEAQRKRVLAR